MKTAKQTRPQWAESLSVADWRALKSCQGRNPTLSALKRDLEWQEIHGIRCPACQSIARQLGLK